MVLARSHLVDVYDVSEFQPVAGDGVWLEDAAGARFLDLYGGHAVALLGHRHPTLLRALAAQAERLFFVSNALDLEVRREAARRLCRFGPADLSRVFFVNSGAEANENALRLAHRATGRPRVVALEGAFHGRTAAAGALTAGHARWYGFPRSPLDFTVVPLGDEAALAAAMGDDVAAVMLEPVQGVAGARPVAPAYVRAARELTRQVGALLVFDEVQTGMGRTGWPFAAQAYGVTPDLLTTAKGLGGGFPVGAVLMREEIAAGLRSGDLGTTFGGGPLACALVIAVLDVLEGDGLLQRVRRLSARILGEARVGPVVDVQGLGFLLGLRTRRPAREVLAELRTRRILAGDSRDPHVLRLLPPLTLEDEHVDCLIATLKELAS